MSSAQFGRCSLTWSHNCTTVSLQPNKAIQQKIERLTNPVDDYLAQPLLRSCSWSAAASANITRPKGQVSPVVWWENKIAGSDVRFVRYRGPLAESVVCMNVMAELWVLRGIRGAFLGRGAQGKQKHEQRSNHREGSTVDSETVGPLRPL